MKYFYRAAALSLGLLSASALQPVFAAGAQLDVDGLPIYQPIRSQITVPFLTKDQILNSLGHGADVVQILQLQAAYEFYHDAHNGNAVASLYTPDGIFEIPYNDGEGHLSPTGGIDGNGCAAYGYNQIAIFFNATPPTPPLPFPAHIHHVMTSAVVTFSSDGNSATLNANYIDDTVGTNNVITMIDPGEYITDFVRIGNEWFIQHLRAVEDTPITTVNCTLNGQLPK